MAKVVCVLCPDPVGRYPSEYVRDRIPGAARLPGRPNAPRPKEIAFTPGRLLGCVSEELGLRPALEAGGHTLVVTSDKEGPDSVFEKELSDADIVISRGHPCSRGLDA